MILPEDVLSSRAPLRRRQQAVKTAGGAPPLQRGYFVATHGYTSGNDTLLRTHWNNQCTGLVNDEVFELKMEPANWGEIAFP